MRIMTDMLRKERKWNHINAQLKPQKAGKKCVRHKQNKNKGKKQKTVTNMVDTNLIIAIIINTLKVNCLMYQLEDRDCHSGSKNKTQLYVSYKKPTLNIKTHKD